MLQFLKWPLEDGYKPENFSINYRGKKSDFYQKELYWFFGFKYPFNLYSSSIYYNLEWIYRQTQQSFNSSLSSLIAVFKSLEE